MIQCKKATHTNITVNISHNYSYKAPNSSYENAKNKFNNLFISWLTSQLECATLQESYKRIIPMYNWDISTIEYVLLLPI